MELILASNSPRRRHLLGLLGWDFRVVPADVDESLVPGESPSKYVLRLAESKARAVGDLAGAAAVVVAADTTVVDGDEILGKPVDAADAERMLRQLRSRVHQVLTAVAVMRSADGALLTDLCVTDVPMRDYTNEEMLAYIASGDPLDKAGAYAIQHTGFHPAENLQGCYANVVGLPLCYLVRIFRELGLPSDAGVPQVCQAVFGYQCNLQYG